MSSDCPKTRPPAWSREHSARPSLTGDGTVTLAMPPLGNVIVASVASSNRFISGLAIVRTTFTNISFVPACRVCFQNHRFKVLYTIRVMFGEQFCFDVVCSDCQSGAGTWAPSSGTKPNLLPEKKSPRFHFKHELQSNKIFDI